MKTCSHCHIEKSLNEFCSNKSTKDGLACYCKLCANAYYKAYYASGHKRPHAYKNTLAWRKKYPERTRGHNRKRRAIKRGLSQHFTPTEWLKLKEEFTNHCIRCGGAEPFVKLSPDHVIPLSKGGKDTIDNIQPLCCMRIGNCQSKKGINDTNYRVIRYTHFSHFFSKVPANEWAKLKKYI